MKSLTNLNGELYSKLLTSFEHHSLQMTDIMKSIVKKSSVHGVSVELSREFKFKEWMSSFDDVKQSKVSSSLLTLNRSRDNRSIDLNKPNVSPPPSIHFHSKNLPPIGSRKVSFTSLNKDYYMPLLKKKEKMTFEASTDTKTSLHGKSNPRPLPGRQPKVEQKSRQSINRFGMANKQTKSSVYISGKSGSMNGLLAKYKHLVGLKQLQ